MIDTVTRKTIKGRECFWTGTYWRFTDLRDAMAQQSGSVTIHRVTLDTSEFHGLASSRDMAERYALAASRREPGVEFICCDTDTGEWLSSSILLDGGAV